jgi:hypothetical protein
MESSILESLPTIHGILTGIGTAFFSGFAMFAYQKLQESKDNLDSVLAEVGNFSTPTTYIGGAGGNNLIADDGSLDWDGVGKNILHDAKSLFSHIDYEEKYGIRQNPASSTPNDDRICSTTRSLCMLLSQLFVSYPFSGNSMVHVSGLSERVESKKSEPFTAERIQEIQRRISFLSWCWETNNRSLITLGQRCSEIERTQAEVEARTSYEENLSRLGDNLDEAEKKRIWETFHQPRLNMQIDYAQIISEFFNKVQVYRDRVLPQLSNCLNNHRVFEERFNFKATTILAFKIIAYIFVFGVLVPILLLGLAADANLVWHPVLPYFLICVTVAPYLYVWFKLLGKVKNFDFG